MPGSCEVKRPELGYVQHAKMLGQSGNYIEGGKELTLALQSLPDNVEAKQLVADFKQHEPEEIERLRVKRLERPKKFFDAAIGNVFGQDTCMRSHELKTTKSAAETHSAIEAQLTMPPAFKITQSDMAGEIFTIDATQNFSGGSRQCVIVGGQSKNNETQIYFKVVESKKVGFFNQPIGALVGARTCQIHADILQ